jgi:hypothetical protein
MGTGVDLPSERRSPEAIHTALRRIHASPTPRSCVTLLLDTGATVDIEQEALLTHGPLRAPNARPIRLVPEQQDVSAALVLFGRRIRSSVAFKSGHLRLVFDSGHHLNVAPHPEFEAWSVNGPGSLHIVGQPAGGLALWR